MELFARILLALLLTMASPAWCACAFAAGHGGETANESAKSTASADGCAAACCPAAEQRSTHKHDAVGYQAVGCDDSEQHRGSMPCRDRSDCSCCDAALQANPPTAARDLMLTTLLRKADLQPMPTVVALVMHLPLIEVAAPPGASDSHDPPPPSARSSLLAQRCLLLV